jgi:hypothetical protein
MIEIRAVLIHKICDMQVDSDHPGIFNVYTLCRLRSGWEPISYAIGSYIWDTDIPIIDRRPENWLGSQTCYEYDPIEFKKAFLE